MLDNKLCERHIFELRTEAYYGFFQFIAAIINATKQ